MITAAILISVFVYTLLFLCQWVTIGNGPWILRNKEIVTIGTVISLIVLIESFK